MAWWRDEPGGAEWLDRLPRLARELTELWELELGEPFEANISLVVPAVRRDGTEAVLKLNFPEPESEHEADALAFWDGVAAVRLLEHDAERRGLLLERCRPGDQLWSVADEEEGNRIGASVLRRLWERPPTDRGYRTLAGEAERWAEELPARWEAEGRPYERRLVDESSRRRSPSSSSPTRTSTAATSSVPNARPGWRSIRSRSSRSGRSTPPRSCATGATSSRSRLTRSAVCAAGSISSRPSSSSTASACAAGRSSTRSPGTATSR